MDIRKHEQHRRHLKKELGKLLFEMRKESGLSMNKLGMILGLTAPTIGLKEKGRQIVSIDDLMLYSSYFEMPVSEIITQAERRAEKRDL